MSCNLRSRNTGQCARTRVTTSGPAAVNSVRPTLMNDTRPDSCLARTSAWSGSERSAATISGFADTAVDLHLSPEIRRGGQSVLCEEVADAVRHCDRGCRIEEVGRSHLHRPCSGKHELDRVLRSGDAPDPND